MTRFSANLGFLWTELDLPDAIHAAAAGFDAVECHWPYDIPMADIRAASALDELGWEGYVRAEYKPRTDTTSGLSWMDAYKQREYRFNGTRTAPCFQQEAAYKVE